MSETSYNKLIGNDGTVTKPNGKGRALILAMDKSGSMCSSFHAVQKGALEIGKEVFS
jgi:hypothetical protein